ncbi:hypothetical protein KIW84_UN0756 [Lathyrus oleraceus]|nr:hypothetical protein KIW84_UN0756 [Pisum sativum]
MDSKRSRSTKKVSWNDLAFINNVISWSLEDIFDQDLYKNQVDTIGLSFDSAKQYLNSFVPPLLEETRAQLCSCIEIISSSPHAQVFSLQHSHSLQHGSNLHRVKTVNDFKRYGNWWHLVLSVDTIGLSFDSAKQYLNSFVPPLLEETRAQLCSCIEIISSSPHAQVFSLQHSHSLQHGSNLHRVETGSFSGDEKELYKSGAVFILADFKPQTVNDFKRYGNWWHLVFSVDTIGLSVDSAKQYLNSFVPPLLEETRAQLCSLFSLQHSHSLQHGSNRHRVETGSFPGDEKELYKSGAIFILADFKPQTVNDFKRYGNWWHLVFSLGISKGEGY